MPPILQALNDLGHASLQRDESDAHAAPIRMLHAPLLPDEGTEDLYNLFLDEVNSILPIFNEASFREMYQSGPTTDPNSEDPAKWACLNTALAIAVQRKATNNFVAAISPYAWNHFRNAMSVYEEILFTSQSLLDLQAVLLMTVFIRNTTDMKFMSLLVAAAARMVRILGLDTDPGDNLDTMEAEQRRRVFWITYMLDIQSSIPPCLPLSLENCNVSLPSASPPDGLGNIQITENIAANTFRLAAELALKQGEAYRILHQGVGGASLLTFCPRSWSSSETG
ncbi:hypothetical protein GQ53DRAFT_815064 [Thozetella sp. PMI_491]|nr:hypothetical protein GQ53DRAFT_815064 [Thozetella sp. PMI_491]